MKRETQHNDYRINKVTHFLNANGITLEQNSKVYLVKTLNEKSGSQTKEKLVKMLDSDKNLGLSLLRSEDTFNIENLDEEGIVYVYGKEFYDLYLITEVSGHYYYMVIQENNFFYDRPNFELVALKKIRRFNYKLYYLNRESIK